MAGSGPAPTKRPSPARGTRQHAGTSRAVVGLGYRADALWVEVADDGHGSTGTGTGHGLVGMRERMAFLGGRLESGPVPAGGYRVQATIPYEPLL